MMMPKTSDCQIQSLASEIPAAHDARGRMAETLETAGKALENSDVAYDQAIGRLIRARATTVAELFAKARALGAAICDEAALDRAPAEAPGYPCEARDRAIALSILRDIVDLDGGTETRLD